MLISRLIVATLSIGAMTGANTVCGQDFPSKVIRIVSGGVGGNSDSLSRLLAQGISGPLGQQVIVVNYPSGNIPGQTVAKAPPDGYTLLVAGGTLWIGPLLQKNPPYDPVRDFAPVTLGVTEPAALVVHPSLPVKSVKELVALAKARPGELNYSSGVAGSQSQLAAELFKYLAGVKINGVPYGSGSVRIAEFIGGHTQMSIDGASAVMPLAKAGKLRALAVGGSKRSALVPGLPTIAESGVPEYESTGKTGVFAPAKTPDAVIRRLNQEMVRFLNLSDTKAQLLNMGSEAAGTTPEELGAMVNAERNRLGKVIQASGIQAQ